MIDEIEMDAALHAAILRSLVRQRRTPLTLLVRQMRKERRDARIDDDAVYQCITGSSLLVGQPGTEVGTLLEVLEGHVLTQRVASPTTGREDLWCTTALQPILAWSSVMPLPLIGGGELTAAEFGHAALVGPPGWIPDAQPGDLLALHIEGGALGITLVDRDVDARAELGQVDQQELRRLLAYHFDVHRVYSVDTWSLPRPGELMSPSPTRCSSARRSSACLACHSTRCSMTRSTSRTSTTTGATPTRGGRTRPSPFPSRGCPRTCTARSGSGPTCTGCPRTNT